MDILDLRGEILITLDTDTLRNANLCGANLQLANLHEADLCGADLCGASLCGANLQLANLQLANLCGANLRRANLRNTKLPDFNITPSEGSFIAWKQTSLGIIKIQIPSTAKRTSSLVSRKCRAEFVKVISGPGCGGISPTADSPLTYNRYAIVQADKYDDDIRVDCTEGIHFFMTREEAEKW